MDLRSISCFALLVMVALASGGVCQLGAQEARPFDRPKPKSDLAETNDGMRAEPSPGVLLFGKPHRFAEVGSVNGFDSSPDGRTLVFSSGKIKFFDLVENKVVEELSEPGESYQHVVFSPSGRNVYAYFYSGRDRVIRVFDAITSTSEGIIPTRLEGEEGARQFNIQRMEVSADGTYIALQGFNAVQVRNVRSGDLVFYAENLNYVQGMCFTTDESELLVSAKGRITVYDVESGEAKSAAESGLANQRCNHLVASLSRELVAISSGNSVKTFDLKQGRFAGTLALPPGNYCQKLAFSDNGSTLLAYVSSQTPGSSGNALFIYDVDSKKLVKKIKVASQGITKMAFSVDQRSIFLSGHGIFGVQEVRVDEDPQLAEQRYPVGPAYITAIHPDGKSFIVCTQGGDISWIDVESGNVTRKMNKPNLISLELDSQGEEAIIAARWGNAQPVMRLNSNSGKMEKSYSVESQKKGGVFRQLRSLLVDGQPNFGQHRQTMPLSVRRQKDPDVLNVLSLEMNFETTNSSLGPEQQQVNTFVVQQLDTESGKTHGNRRFELPQLGLDGRTWVQHAAIHPDGTQFAIGNANKVKVASWDSDETIEDLEIETTSLHKLDYSPAGNFLYASSYDGVWVWHADDGELANHFELEGGMAYVSFSSDDSKMVICPRKIDAKVSIYTTKKWKEIFSRKSTASGRRSVLLSPHGDKLLIGLADCRLELWDLAMIN